MAREIIHAGLHNREFIERATTGFDEYAASVEAWTLERGELETGVPADVIRDAAHAYARADRAMICWTLGITEHHNAVDNVFALINLALLTGHVGRYGSGPEPAARPEQRPGRRRHGRDPEQAARLPGHRARRRGARAGSSRPGASTIQPRYGWHLTQMFEAMERGELRTLYVVGENPAQSEADAKHTKKLLEGLDHLVVQDIFLTRTAELADVVLPASASWCEAEGTVTNSERRVQRVPQGARPAGPGPRRHRDRVRHRRPHRPRLGPPDAESVWTELRSLSPMHAGMTYPRLEELGGIQWPCCDEEHPGELFLHGRLWESPITGPPAPFNVVEHVLPVDKLSDEFPIRLTTGRRLDSYNTGVQSGGYTLAASAARVARPLARGLRAAGRGRRRAWSRSPRGAGRSTRPCGSTRPLRPGLAFMTLHFPDEVETNVLTIDATDPKSGTAEFKASAIRVDRLTDAERTEQAASQLAVPAK